MTLIDSIHESTNLLQDSANLQILLKGWIDQLEALHPKFGLNWRDQKLDIKKVPGQLPEDLPPVVMVQRQWGALKEVDDNRGPKGAQSCWPPAEEQEPERITDKPGFESWQIEGLNDSDEDNTMPKEQTFKAQACLKELKMNGSVNESIAKKVLIDEQWVEEVERHTTLSSCPSWASQSKRIDLEKFSSRSKLTSFVVLLYLK